MIWKRAEKVLIMKNIKLILILAALIFVVNNTFGQSRIGGRVVGVIDGKTVAIEMPNGSRLTAVLQYIEVPEPDQPLHKIAAEHLSALVLDKKVEFRARSITPLKTAGSLYVNNIDIGQQMIRDGAAWYAILEKSGQEATESATYQSNEALAKAEKRGVWSIADLKPSWEIRAEAKENRRRQEEKIAREAAELAAKTAEATPVKPKVVVRQQLSTESQMWAGTNEKFGKMPENVTNIGGLMIGYNPMAKIGFAATPLLKIEVADKDGSQAIGVGIAYLYGDDERKGRQTVYLVGVESESRDFRFLKFNDLTVTADNQKIVVGKAKRAARQTDFSAKEFLTYEIKRSVIVKIANAKNVQIKVGNYSGKVPENIQAMLLNLLKASE